MNGYERIIKMMGNTSTEPNVFITIMDGADSCKINNLSLTSEDLLIAEHLTVRQIKSIVQDNTTKAITIEYIEPIKQGDTVIVMKLNDTKYAILERVV